MLVIGIGGHELTAQERDWLQHPTVAGVILFSRNFASKAQVAELAAAIREAEPEGFTISIGGEIGEVGKYNSTVEDLEAFKTTVAAMAEEASPPEFVFCTADAVEPLPDGRFLITEKSGQMRIVTAKGEVSEPLVLPRRRHEPGPVPAAGARGPIVRRLRRSSAGCPT